MADKDQKYRDEEDDGITRIPNRDEIGDRSKDDTYSDYTDGDVDGGFNIGPSGFPVNTSQRRVDLDHDDYDEEFAAEAAAIDRPIADRGVVDDDEASGKGIGWLSLILSVIGLFFLPIIMGAAGIIIGIVAMRKGAKTLGGWAIGIGIASIAIMLFTAPFT